MKYSQFFSLAIIFSLLLPFSSLNAQAAHPPFAGSVLLASFLKYIAPSDQLFFVDPENGTLFIDFMSVNDKVTGIIVKQNNKSLFIEDVRHISSKSIYELQTDLFDTGIYQVEIQTQIGFKYSQDILIQSINTSSQ